MTWEEAVNSIRKKPEYVGLIKAAYLDENLVSNVESFSASQEFQLTLQLIREYCPGCKRILDIGSGNGISCVAFALQGFEVVSLEPDPSGSLGYHAIVALKEQYSLNNLTVIKQTAESAALDAELPFDLVYARQSMHHADDLTDFIVNSGRHLRDAGMYFTVRDHVVFNNADKQLFLDQHPLHHLYGGENAYSEEEYLEAFTRAQLRVKKVIRYFDSPINYFPITDEDVANLIRVKLLGKLSFFRRLGRICNLLFSDNDIQMAKKELEKNFAGRMYSFIAVKQ